MGLQSHLEIDLGVVENQWLFEIDFQGELKTPTAPSNDCLEIENHPLTISKQKFNTWTCLLASVCGY